MKRKLFYVSFMVGIICISLSSFAQQSAEFYLKNGLSFIEKKNYQEAFEELDKAYKLDSKDPNIIAFRGQALQYLKRYTEAIESYDLALQIQPNYAEVFHLRGLAKFELKDLTGACEDWDQANKLGYDMVIDLIIEYCMKAKPNK
jgi:tetratricopeptide (TPR) repeat protein